jgi:hypothetical protein
VRSERQSKRLAESDEPSLAGAVGGLFWFAAKRAARRDIDDAAAAAVDHVLRSAPRNVRRTNKVHAQGLIPRALPLLVTGLRDRMRHEHAGVVDEHVEAAQSISSAVDHPSDRGCVSQISADDGVPVARQRR